MRYLSQTVNILVECDPAGNRTRYKDVHELLGHIAHKIFALLFTTWNIHERASMSLTIGGWTSSKQC